MKVLVTGASGFLGSHIAELLVADGHEVRALVRSSSKISFLRTLPHVELATGTIEDRASLDAAAQGVDAVVHSAALVKARTPAEFRAVNVEGTRSLLDAVRKGSPSLRRFVLVSSLAAVGPSPDGRPVDPEPSRAITHYGRSKYEAERVVREAASEVPATILRPPMIYGPRDQEALAFFKSVSRRVLPFVGDGRARMNVIYATDAARACVRAIDADVPSGSTYFVHDGRVYVWREMLEEIERTLGRRALLRMGLPIPIVWLAAVAGEASAKLTGKAVMLTRDKLGELRARYWVCDASSACRDLGWSPRVEWPEGVRLTADWYRSEGWL